MNLGFSFSILYEKWGTSSTKEVRKVRQVILGDILSPKFPHFRN